MLRRRALLALGAAAVTGGCLDSGSGNELDDDPGDEQNEDPEDSTGNGSGASSGEDDPTEESDDGSSQSWPSGAYADYETTTVGVETPDGETLGSVTAAIASEGNQRYLGLSDAPSMPEDGGMLFVYEAVEDRTFVMREMDFGIDIVYADADGVITEIHNAPEPGPEENGNEQRYPGRGQYVLEVNYRWTDEHDVDVGDVLAFELP